MNILVRLYLFEYRINAGQCKSECKLKLNESCTVEYIKYTQLNTIFQMEQSEHMVCVCGVE